MYVAGVEKSLRYARAFLMVRYRDRFRSALVVLRMWRTRTFRVIVVSASVSALGLWLVGALVLLTVLIKFPCDIFSRMGMFRSRNSLTWCRTVRPRVRAPLKLTLGLMMTCVCGTFVVSVWVTWLVRVLQMLSSMLLHCGLLRTARGMFRVRTR